MYFHNQTLIAINNVKVNNYFSFCGIICNVAKYVGWVYA